MRLSRRHFVQASLATALMPAALAAAIRADRPLPWADFLAQMKQLAAARSDRRVTQSEVATHGLQLMQQLDASDPALQQAVDAAFESGNRFWLWQRLTRASDIKGGILNIEQGQDVPLHDHPGATGMVRVLEGEVEVWQFDPPAGGDQQVVLQRVAHRLLRPGDTAVLSPTRGNIHALRARSSRCRMLDYFVPPYVRSERHWFLPLDDDWDGRRHISCRRIAEDEFYMS